MSICHYFISSTHVNIIICIAACQIISNGMYISVKDNSVARHNLYKYIINALQMRLGSDSEDFQTPKSCTNRWQYLVTYFNTRYKSLSKSRCRVVPDVFQNWS